MNIALREIASNPDYKRRKNMPATKAVQAMISSYRFNALNKVGGQYSQYLMNSAANFLEKQLREALSH